MPTFVTDVHRSFTVSPYTYTNTFVGNTTNTVLTVNGASGFYAYPPATPPPADTPEAWLRQRVKEVCDLVAA